MKRDEDLGSKLRTYERISQERALLRKNRLRRRQLIRLVIFPFALGALALLLAMSVAAIDATVNRIDLVGILEGFFTEMIGAGITVLILEIIWSRREENLEQEYREQLARYEDEMAKLKALVDATRRDN